MNILLLIAGFCVLCLSGCVGTLIIAQKLINRAFDMVDFCAFAIDKHINRNAYDADTDITRPEISD